MKINLKIRDYIIRRLILLIPVILGISLFSFILSYNAGDPISLYISPKTPQWMIEEIRKEHHLDDPLYIQYLFYLKNLLQGNLGYSRSQWMPVIECIKIFFPATLELAVVALLISLIIGIPLGIISATRKDRISDHFSRIFCLSGVSMPSFWLALLLQYIFFYFFKKQGLPYLPGGGRHSININISQITGFLMLDSIITGNFRGFMDVAWHIIMPAFIVSMWPLASISRIMRSSMLEVLRQDYIVNARSKGLSERVVIYKHALKNAMIPTVTAVGYCIGYLLTGSVMVETVFSWPGLGRWAVHAIESIDIAAIVAFTMLTALIFLFTNLFVDIIYAWIDPRVRY